MTTTTVFHEPLLRRIDQLTQAANEFAEIVEANQDLFTDWRASVGGTVLFLERKVEGVGDAKALAKAIGGKWQTYKDCHWTCNRWRGVEVWIRHRDEAVVGDYEDVDLS